MGTCREDKRQAVVKTGHEFEGPSPCDLEHVTSPLYLGFLSCKIRWVCMGYLPLWAVMCFHKASVWYRARYIVRTWLLLATAVCVIFVRKDILWQRGQHEHRGEGGKSRENQDTVIKPLWLEHRKSGGENRGEGAGLGLGLNPQHHTKKAG